MNQSGERRIVLSAPGFPVSDADHDKPFLLNHAKALSAAGLLDLLNILDAEKELTQAEASLVNSRFQLITSAYSLLKACGLLNFEYLGINK